LAETGIEEVVVTKRTRSLILATLLAFALAIPGSGDDDTAAETSVIIADLRGSSYRTARFA